MLKYDFKLGSKDISERQVEFGEKYLAEDLSFVSGVTSVDYHLDNVSSLQAYNPLIKMDGRVKCVSENVERSGYVVIVGKRYDVHEGSIVDYTEEKDEVSKLNYYYVNIGGKYYYAYDELADGHEDMKPKTFIINDFLVNHPYELDGDDVKCEVIPMDVKAKIADDGMYIKLDTVAWIENGLVTIDGNTYVYDKEAHKEDGSLGGLRYTSGGDVLPSSAITACDAILINEFKSASEYKEVTRFRLERLGDEKQEFDSVSFCGYYSYVMYKGYYAAVSMVTDGEDYHFECNIPNHLLNGGADDGSLTAFALHFSTDSGVDLSDASIISASNVGEHGIMNLDDLARVTSFIVVESYDGENGSGGTVYYTESVVQNSNDGRMLAVYLSDDSGPLGVGDVITFKSSSDEEHGELVYEIDGNTYGFIDGDTDFVLFKGEKYLVEDGLCDKALIDGIEYPIRYINGKVNGKDCLVSIADEEVPMKIVVDGDSLKVERYGNVVLDVSSGASAATYDVKSYSGITVDGEKYAIKEDDGKLYAEVSDFKEYKFTVIVIIGSSMVVCEPTMQGTYFTDKFIDAVSVTVCRDVVNNQYSFKLYYPNNIFGSDAITDKLAFRASDMPKSSDDFYDLFSSFELYANDGYYTLPIMLGTCEERNIMQDDLVTDKFFNRVKRESINPIVDMEKDIYVPKYFDGKYEGSSTDFKPIEEIRVNLHFRTRDLESWKIKEDGNWFIMDIEPYKKLLSSSGKTFMETSDLVGLLYFTDDDVFYQKEKVSSSFLRFSFYDSMDPQTQSLLCTSTVFMDMHGMFKKYIDNSRKYINNYGVVNTNGTVRNKISVQTEWLGSTKDNKNPNSRFQESQGVIIDESHRVGSRFVINSKHSESMLSSEGFYLYIFKEYSENLHPKPIYMKVEFNHAGVGRTIPFTIPMKWEANAESKVNEQKVVSRLTLENDVEKIKEGYKLAQVYAQSYIPLYAVYDYKNKEYAYVFDDRYVSTEETEDGVTYVNLNLFELKLKDESEDAPIGSMIRKTQERYVVDVNEQFKTEDDA